MHAITFLPVATLASDSTFIPLPLRWRRYLNVSNQRLGECSPLQRPFAICNIQFQMTHPNAVDRLGRTTYEQLSGLTS